MTLEFPEKLYPLFEDWRYKVLYGGRGGAKSWGVARALLVIGAGSCIRVLCAREYQTSIRDSVHRLLSDQIAALGLEYFYTVKNESIVGRNGTEFIFKGLHHNATEIKSMEGVDITWVEEAEKVSDNSWDFLIPTIRKEGSEIWITFNPYLATDPTYRRFVLNPPANAIVIKINYEDNPWFPDTLLDEMEHCKRTDPDKYEWVWRGKPRGLSQAQVFRGHYRMEPFDIPNGVQLFHGADWGFANDPTTLVRMFVLQRKLYISHEVYGVGVDLDQLPRFFDRIQDVRRWKIIADCARPETISFMRRNGFNVVPSKKWPGSVEDGIEYIKSFDEVVIHPRCPKTFEEFELYAYKQDRQTNEVLPVLLDANNHCIDSIRYGLGDYIIRKSAGAPSQDVRGYIGV